MYTTCKPTKILLYTTTAKNKKTAKQVKTATGCDIVINGTLYNMSSFDPVCNVKADKKILSKNQYTYAGYGWNNNTGNMVMTTDMDSYDNYISCVCLVNYGQKQTMYGTDGLEGVRGRTAIGFKKDGTMVIYVSRDGQSGSYGACSLETLQTRMLNLGCYTALNLDGGGSSQFLSDEDKVSSTRKVQNYLCIWIEKEDKKEETTKPATNTTISTTNKTTTSTTSDTVQYKVNAYSLNVRRGHGTSYSIIKSIKKNTIVEISKKYGNWGYIPSLKGWVSMSYVKKV